MVRPARVPPVTSLDCSPVDEGSVEVIRDLDTLLGPADDRSPVRCPAIAVFIEVEPVVRSIEGAAVDHHARHIVREIQGRIAAPDRAVVDHRAGHNILEGDSFIERGEDGSIVGKHPVERVEDGNAVLSSSRSPRGRSCVEGQGNATGNRSQLNCMTCRDRKISLEGKTISRAESDGIRDRGAPVTEDEIGGERGVLEQQQRAGGQGQRQFRHRSKSRSRGGFHPILDTISRSSPFFAFPQFPIAQVGKESPFERVSTGPFPSEGSASGQHCRSVGRCACSTTPRHGPPRSGDSGSAGARRHPGARYSVSS